MLQIEWPTDVLERFAVESERDITRFAVEFIQELNNEVVRATPVKTGFLQGSWFGEVGSMPDGTGAVGRDAAGEMNAAAAAFRPGDTYYAVNTAKYAAFVEYGTSRMAPRAFVRGVIARTKEIAARVAARIKTS